MFYLREYSFRKYVRKHLADLKRKIELIQLETFENSTNSADFFFIYAIII